MSKDRFKEFNNFPGRLSPQNIDEPANTDKVNVTINKEAQAIHSGTKWSNDRDAQIEMPRSLDPNA